MIELDALQRYARRASTRHAPLACELCMAPIAEEHRHVFDVADRKLLCTCQACTLVFDHDTGRLRAVSPDVRIVAAFDIEQRATLRVPVGLAFFTRSSSLGRWVAIFPSPAGPTEAEVEEDAARVLEERVVRDDIEALLVRTQRSGESECFVTPIDVCYECVAALRTTWKGIGGGDEAHHAIDAIIDRLRARGRS